MNNRDIVEYALRHTKILKMPRRKLSTFGTTNIEYYMLSRVNDITRVREGRVISHRPTIIKPAEISELFEGFGDSAGEYGEALFEFMGSNPRILSYRFRNNPGSSSESVDPVPDVYNRVRKKIKESGSGLTAILEGIDSAWQVSVMKVIIDMTLKSAGGNIAEMEEKGMFPDDKGVPENVRNRIEFMFSEAEKDRAAINKLGNFLNSRGLFKEYEDRFFRLMGK